MTDDWGRRRAIRTARKQWRCDDCQDYRLDQYEETTCFPPYMQDAGYEPGTWGTNRRCLSCVQKRVSR